jgi:hypothetical protein
MRLIYYSFFYLNRSQNHACHTYTFVSFLNGQNIYVTWRFEWQRVRHSAESLHSWSLQFCVVSSPTNSYAASRATTRMLSPKLPSKHSSKTEYVTASNKSFLKAHKLITASTIQWTLSRTKWIQSIRSHRILFNIACNNLSSSRLNLAFQVASHSEFSTTIIYALLPCVLQIPPIKSPNRLSY